MPPTWPMIQLLGNGRGQYGSTRNAGLWALAEKAAKIKLMSAAIKKAHRDFSMISSLVIRPAADGTGRSERPGSYGLFAYSCAAPTRKAVLCHLSLRPDNDRAPTRSGTGMLTSDAAHSYSW